MSELSALVYMLRRWHRGELPKQHRVLLDAAADKIESLAGDVRGARLLLAAIVKQEGGNYRVLASSLEEADLPDEITRLEDPVTRDIVFTVSEGQSDE